MPTAPNIQIDFTPVEEEYDAFTRFWTHVPREGDRIRNGSDWWKVKSVAWYAPTDHVDDPNVRVDSTPQVLCTVILSR